MKRLAAVLVLALSAGVAATAGAQPAPEEQRALRERLEQRFDLIPLSDGVALRPKSPVADVRLVEVTSRAILVNGTPVTGGELRERLGEDAEAVLQLSYLSPDARSAIAGQPALPVEAAQPPPPPGAPAPEVPPSPAERPERRARHSTGDRVRVFGDVAVQEDESVSGQVVAVLGSVRVDGAVGDQVVSVLGSIDLGPNAYIRGDVVSVGGRVRRAPGAVIRGGVTEVSLADPNLHFNFEPLFGWTHFPPFAAFPRLVGSALRFLLLLMLTSLAFVLARPTVEASAARVTDSPVQSALVGLAAQFLLVPAIILTAIILAISIIGIPLLLLIPFAIIVLLLVALAGFAGVAVSVGQWTRRRLGVASESRFVDIVVGLTVILLPVLVARLVALSGWPGTPLAIMLLMVGFVVEFFAWSSGFGAVLTNAFGRWQARRHMRVPPAPPAPPSPVVP